jgi:hypothetical protein
VSGGQRPDGPAIAVGARFTTFIANKNVADAAELIEEATRDEGGPPRQVVLGQGLSARQLADLAGLEGIDVVAPDGNTEPADRRLTHLRKDANTLISAVRQCSAESYEAALLAGQDSAALDDHITGQHLPAMLLLEACRQMWTAVTESFLLSGPGSRRFVVARITSEFSRYAFPLPATLRYTLLDRETGPVGEKFTARIDIIQLGSAAAEVTAEYRVVDELVAAKHESMGARQAIATLLTSLPVPAAAATARAAR